MKRNELVFQIKKLLDTLETVRVSNAVRADAIIAEIERVGMTPPPVTKVKRYSPNMEVIENVQEWED